MALTSARPPASGTSVAGAGGCGTLAGTLAQSAWPRQRQGEGRGAGRGRWAGTGGSGLCGGSSGSRADGRWPSTWVGSDDQQEQEESGSQSEYKTSMPPVVFHHLEHHHQPPPTDLGRRWYHCHLRPRPLHWSCPATLYPSVWQGEAASNPGTSWWQRTIRTCSSVHIVDWGDPAGRCNNSILLQILILVCNLRCIWWWQNK